MANSTLVSVFEPLSLGKATDELGLPVDIHLAAEPVEVSWHGNSHVKLSRGKFSFVVRADSLLWAIDDQMEKHRDAARRSFNERIREALKRMIP